MVLKIRIYLRHNLNSFEKSGSLNKLSKIPSSIHPLFLISFYHPFLPKKSLRHQRRKDKNPFFNYDAPSYIIVYFFLYVEYRKVRLLCQAKCHENVLRSVIVRLFEDFIKMIHYLSVKNQLDTKKNIKT